MPRVAVAKWCSGLGWAVRALGASRLVTEATLRLLQAQQALARHKEVGQRAGNHQAVPVLGESAVAHLGEAEDPLDHSYRMLHSNPDSRLPAIRGATAGPAVREVPRLRSTDAQHR